MQYIIEPFRDLLWQFLTVVDSLYAQIVTKPPAILFLFQPKFALVSPQNDLESSHM